jgi:hypothetical protein
MTTSPKFVPRRPLGGRRSGWMLALFTVGLGLIPAEAPAAPVGATVVLPNFSRVVVVVLENHEYGQVLGNPDAPYINSLAESGALAEAYYGIMHPSLPNYLSLTGGSTFGIRRDCPDCLVEGENIVDQLEEAGISWKAYMEDMPHPCFWPAYHGLYDKDHNPFMHYTDVATVWSRCGRVVPASQLVQDESSGGLPRFVWLTPNICHNMHNCGVGRGDRYLSQALPPLISSLGPDGVLFLTFDEGTSDKGCCRYAEGGHVVTIVAGAGVKPGYVSPVMYDHYSLLRTIEDAWGLPELGHARDPASAPMADFFLTGELERPRRE